MELIVHLIRQGPLYHRNISVLPVERHTHQVDQGKPILILVSIAESTYLFNGLEGRLITVTCPVRHPELEQQNLAAVEYHHVRLAGADPRRGVPFRAGRGTCSGTPGITPWWGMRNSDEARIKRARSGSRSPPMTMAWTWMWRSRFYP